MMRPPSFGECIAALAGATTTRRSSCVHGVRSGDGPRGSMCAAVSTAVAASGGEAAYQLLLCAARSLRDLRGALPHGRARRRPHAAHAPGGPVGPNGPHAPNHGPNGAPLRVFYGVQGTGNGHITRARCIATKLREAGADVTWMFSGRPRDDFFDMEVFGDFQWRAGLTLQTRKGELDYGLTIYTVVCHQWSRFVRDVMSLDLSGYDRVVTDFEPVTAWAALLQGVPIVGIGHQYAFGRQFDVPTAGADALGTLCLQYFAPVTVGLGVHWHHFDGAILPPIIDVGRPEVATRPTKIVVYLPFEELDDVLRLLAPFASHTFHVYNPGGPVDADVDEACAAHIRVKGLSRGGFQADFADCGGVICNAGFELPSEALHYGKKLLVKPLHRQMEQLSNALALKELGIGDVMHDLDAAIVATWLAADPVRRVRYPDVAGAVARWILRGDLTVDPSWVDSVWRRTAVGESGGEAASP